MVCPRVRIGFSQMCLCVITHSSLHQNNTGSAPICPNLQLPTDVIHWCACIHTLRHLSQHWSRWRHLQQSISQLIGTKRLAFMLCPEIYEGLRACVAALCVRAQMHTLAAYAQLAVWKGSGWCAYWHLTSLSLLPLLVSRLPSLQPSIPQSITFL